MDASIPDSSTITGRFGGTKKRKKWIFTVRANQHRIKLSDHYTTPCLYIKIMLRNVEHS